MIKIQIHIDGQLCEFNPSEDITTLELAYLTQFMLCCCLSSALADTPAQSLAHLHNEVLEEAAGVADEHGAYLSAKAIRAMKGSQ